MKHVFIVNPASGKKQADNIIKRIESNCLKRNIEYKIHITTKANEAKEIALEYKNEKNIIFAVGGDGTVNEVLNGIVGTNNLLGVIPVGSGNDFYKTIDEINEDVFKCDLGKINDKYFINITCIGLDADIANNTKYMKKVHIPASKIYEASIVYSFIKYKFYHLKTIINNIVRKGDYTIITICNASYYGGGYKIAPSANVSDGLFDIYLVDKMSKLKIPKLLGKAKYGEHENDISVHKYQSDKIIIESENTISANYDGEELSGKRFELSLAKEAITIYHNRDFIKRIVKGE